MRRALVALSGFLVAGVLFALLTSGSEPAPEASGPTVLESANLSRISKPVPPPRAKFTRTIYATSNLKRADLMLDFCRGPIAIDVGDDRPVLVAEHDFCGGSAWIPKLKPGQAVKLSGSGVVRGTYIVSRVVLRDRGKTRVRDLPDADIVLQTCVSPQNMVLVGVDRFDPTLPL